MKKGQRELEKCRDEVVKGAFGTSAHSVSYGELIVWRVNWILNSVLEYLCSDCDDFDFLAAYIKLD